MSLMLERDKVYRARNGSLWRVVCVDSPLKGTPVVAIGIRPANPAEDGADYQGCVRTYRLDGTQTSSDEMRLIAEHREPREWTLGRNSPQETWRQVVFVPGREPYKETVRVREVLEP